MLRQNQSKIKAVLIGFVLSVLVGCATRPVHLYDPDEVYRTEREEKISVLYDSGGGKWIRAGKVTIPVGTSFMGHFHD